MLLHTRSSKMLGVGNVLLMHALFIPNEVASQYLPSSSRLRFSVFSLLCHPRCNSDLLQQPCCLLLLEYYGKHYKCVPPPTVLECFVTGSTLHDIAPIFKIGDKITMLLPTRDGRPSPTLVKCERVKDAIRGLPISDCEQAQIPRSFKHVWFYRTKICKDLVEWDVQRQVLKTAIRKSQRELAREEASAAV